jgi:hypothetical protein
MHRTEMRCVREIVTSVPSVFNSADTTSPPPPVDSFILLIDRD